MCYRKSLQEAIAASYVNCLPFCFGILKIKWHVILQFSWPHFENRRGEGPGDEIGLKTNLNSFIYILEGMKIEEQELLERNEGNDRKEEDPEVDQQADCLEDAFDREFWIKVSTLYDFLNELFFKTFNSESGLFEILWGRL